MILTFLRAEIDSSRYGKFVEASLTELGLTRRLLDQPNLTSANENDTRKRLLAFRGYGMPTVGPESLPTAVFTNFPTDAKWRRVILEEEDLMALRYGNHPFWTALSDGTRLVTRGAQNLNLRRTEPVFSGVLSLRKSIGRGQRLHELLVAEATGGTAILVEGHLRATAYALEGFTKPIDALLASSPSMAHWRFY